MGIFKLGDFTAVMLNWVLVLLWPYPFILSGVISPLISSSILGTYQPGEFLFQLSYHFAFSCCSGVLKARKLKWFAIPFSSGPYSVRPLHHDPSVLGGPTWHGLVSLSNTRLWFTWSDWLVICDCGFRLSDLGCPLTVPTVSLGFLLPWMWGISSGLLQQSAAATPYLGGGVGPLHCCPWPWTWDRSSPPHFCMVLYLPVHFC